MNDVRFFRIFKAHLLAFSALMAFNLSACGKGFQAMKAEEVTQLTGAKNKNGVPYTAAGDSAELSALKASIDSSNPRNQDLARRIDGVRIARFDKNGAPTLSNPAQLEIQIVVRDMQPSPLAFRVVFTGSGHTAKGVRSKAPRPDLSIDAHCFDSDCDAVEIRLKLSGALSGFIQRKRTAKVVALGPFDSKANESRLGKLTKAIQAQTEWTLFTTEIAWGPSTFSFQAGDVLASGGLTQTGSDEEPVAVSLKGEGPFEARLLGNNNRGDLLIRVADQKLWSFLRVILPKDTGDSPIAPINEPGPSADRLIDWDPTHPITRTFQEDLAHPEIQEIIAHAKARTEGAAGRLGRWLDSFVNGVRPSVPMMTEILKQQGLPAEIIFITMIESDYFRTPGFPIGRSKAKAVGPWQFIPSTAGDYKLKLTPCDERKDLELSTQAAAKYFAKLFKLFPHDPKLALVSYNWGQGNVRRAISKLEELQTAGYDFWALRELNTLPEESVAYTMNFIVSQYLGREPIRNGFPYDGKEYPIAPQACPRN